jgi:hypothetical protein
MGQMRSICPASDLARDETAAAAAAEFPPQGTPPAPALPGREMTERSGGAVTNLEEPRTLKIPAVSRS